MMFENLPAKRLTIDVRVDFGGRDLLVAEHFLNGTKIGASFEQMRGKRMSERMRTDRFLHAGHFGLLLYNMKHHDAAQPCAAAAEKENILAARLYLHAVAVDLIEFDLVKCPI